jgi:hypothetical protein
VIPPANQSEPTAVIPDQPTMVVTNTQGCPSLLLKPGLPPSQINPPILPHRPKNRQPALQRPPKNPVNHLRPLRR